MSPSYILARCDRFAFEHTGTPKCTAVSDQVQSLQRGTRAVEDLRDATVELLIF